MTNGPLIQSTQSWQQPASEGERMMERRRLGESTLDISKLSLGGMSIGPAATGHFMAGHTCEEGAYELMDQALELGINCIDSADVYGDEGASERIIGQWLHARGCRDEMILSTKFGYASETGRGAGPERIRACLEGALRRLQTDRIDLFQLHLQDLETPLPVILRTLEDQIQAGKIRFAGISNAAVYHLARANELGQQDGLASFVSLQAQYNLIVRDVEREHLPFLRDRKMGLLCWSPLAGGFLSGKYTPTPDAKLGRLGMDRRLKIYDKPRNWQIIDALRTLAEAHGASPAQVALAWLLAQPAVTSVIVGARSAQQLAESAGATTLRLDDEQRKQLNRASRFATGYPYDFLRRAVGRW